MTELIPEECISECIVDEITDVLVPQRRTRDSHAQGGVSSSFDVFLNICRLWHLY